MKWILLLVRSLERIIPTNTAFFVVVCREIRLKSAHCKCKSSSMQFAFICISTGNMCNYFSICLWLGDRETPKSKCLPGETSSFALSPSFSLCVVYTVLRGKLIYSCWPSGIGRILRFGFFIINRVTMEIILINWSFVLHSHRCPKPMISFPLSLHNP